MYFKSFIRDIVHICGVMKVYLLNVILLLLLMLFHTTSRTIVFNRSLGGVLFTVSPLVFTTLGTITCKSVLFIEKWAERYHSPVGELTVDTTHFSK